MTNLYEEVTNQILEMMESVSSSEELWTKLGQDIFAPRNFTTGAFYSGVNILILANAMRVFGYEKNEWLTYKQARAIGASVRKGEKSVTCVFFKKVEVTKENVETGMEEKGLIPMLKAFNLFNIAQLENVKESNEPAIESSEFESIQAGEAVLNNLVEKGAKIEFGGDNACYIPSRDLIRLPTKEQFNKPEYFYSVLFHEASHWTGNKTRLDRDLSGRFGSESYAMEELIAELSSAFTCAKTNIITHTMEDHACYLKSWIKVLKNDTKAIFYASAKAQKAHEFIMS